MGKAFATEATLGALVLATAGVAASLVLFISLVGGFVSFCPLYMVVHAMNLTLIPALKRLSRQNTGQLLASLQAAGWYLIGKPAASPVEDRWKVVGFVTTLLVSIVIFQWIYVEAEPCRAAAGSGPTPQQVLAAYQAESQQDIPDDADDPRQGLADAPVRIVVFSSFQCQGCRKFSYELSHILEHYVGQITVRFKHYPLGKACNPRLRIDKHPQDCSAAWAAEAARRQGRFWPFHDALFGADLKASAQDNFAQPARKSDSICLVSTPNVMTKRRGARSRPTFAWASRSFRQCTSTVGASGT